MRSIRWMLMSIALLWLSQAASTRAATIIWDGGGATNNWSEGANWLGDIAPGVADTARFDATSVKNSIADIAFSLAALDLQATYSGQIAVNAPLAATGSNIIDGKISFASGITVSLGNVAIGATGLFSGDASFTYLDGVSVNSGTWSMTGADAVIKFADASSVDINGPSTVQFIGAAGHLLVLGNTSGGFTTWSIDADATSIVQAQFVHLTNSAAGGLGAPLVALDSVDGGNNTNWIFRSSPTIAANEPGQLALFAMGLVSFVYLRWRPRKAALTR